MYLPDWKVIKGDPHLGDDWVSSELYADTLEGLMTVLSVPLVLTASDHNMLRVLEKRHQAEEDIALGTLQPRRWWRTLVSKVCRTEQESWRDMIMRHQAERKGVYETRRSHEYLDAHRHLLLSVPRAYELLRSYREGGCIDSEELRLVLDVAEGRSVPEICKVYGVHCSCTKERRRDQVSPLLGCWTTSKHKRSDTNYLSSVGYSGDVQAELPSGELCTVAYISFPLTKADRAEEKSLEKRRWDEVSALLKEAKVRWWWRKWPLGVREEYMRIQRRYNSMDVYRRRHSAEYFKAHLHLVLACPQMYTMLSSYRDTGVLDRGEVDRVLDVAEGRVVPVRDAQGGVSLD